MDASMLSSDGARNVLEMEGCDYMMVAKVICYDYPISAKLRKGDTSITLSPSICSG